MKTTLTILLLAISLFLYAQDNDKPCGGVSRWSVKTLTDNAADSINRTSEWTTIKKLSALKPEKKITRTTPRLKAEKQVYTVRCQIKDFFKEADGDLHLVLFDAQTKQTMIAEIPDPRCPDVQRSKYYDMIRKSFEDFTAQKNGEYSGNVFVMGTGFFDLVHGTKQRGVSLNGFEIHPVLRIYTR